MQEACFFDWNKLVSVHFTITIPYISFKCINYLYTCTYKWYQAIYVSLEFEKKCVGYKASVYLDQ